MPDQSKKRTIRIFAAASFFNDMGSDMIYPVWPLFVTTVLNANMAVLGFIDGLGEALVSISQAVSGILSDRWGKRKVFIWVGYMFGSLSRLGYAVSTAWQHLIPFRILDRGGKIRSAPRDAIIADISTRDERGRNFGLLRSMDNLGAVAGILICIALVNLIGYRNLFFLAAIPSAVAFLLVLFMIREPKEALKAIRKKYSLRHLDRNLRLFLILSALFSLGSFSYSFLLIYAREFGFKVEFVPVLYLIFTLMAAGFSYFFGRLADRVGRKPVLILSYVLWALVAVVFLFFREHAGIIIAFVLYGLHRAALEPVQKTLVSELSVPEYRASTLGGYQMVIGLCALPASAVAGILWDRIGFTVPLFVSLGLTAAAVVMMLFVSESAAYPPGRSSAQSISR
jgi:MFS family permease